MGDDQILQRLRDELASAQQRHDEASKRYGDALHDGGTRAAEGVRKASDEYGHTQREMTNASSRLTNYLRHGIVPRELKDARKKAIKKRKTPMA